MKRLSVCQKYKTMGQPFEEHCLKCGPPLQDVHSSPTQAPVKKMNTRGTWALLVLVTVTRTG